MNINYYCVGDHLP